MTKAEWVEVLNDIERKGLDLANKSFECGAHTTEENNNRQKVASYEFSSVIDRLKKQIISKGV